MGPYHKCYTVPFVVFYKLFFILDNHFDLRLTVFKFGITTTIFWLITLVPAIFLTIKRCHDRNRTGWFSLLLFVPVIFLWPIVELCFLKGKDENNKYGNLI